MQVLRLLQVREALQTQLSEAQARWTEQSENDSRQIAVLEQRIRQLKEEASKEAQLRKQQLLELGLLREEERKRLQADHAKAVEEARLEFQRHRLAAEKQHADEMEHLLKKVMKQLLLCRDFRQSHSTQELLGLNSHHAITFHLSLQLRRCLKCFNLSKCHTTQCITRAFDKLSMCAPSHTAISTHTNSRNASHGHNDSAQSIFFYSFIPISLSTTIDILCWESLVSLLPWATTSTQVRKSSLISSKHVCLGSKSVTHKAIDAIVVVNRNACACTEAILFSSKNVLAHVRPSLSPFIFVLHPTVEGWKQTLPLFPRSQKV